MSRRYRFEAIPLPRDYRPCVWLARGASLMALWHYRHDGLWALALGGLAFVAVLLGLRGMIGGPRR